eukprot:1153372-Ditylum_brightwellii.AAC.1
MRHAYNDDQSSAHSKNKLREDIESNSASEGGNSGNNDVNDEEIGNGSDGDDNITIIEDETD